MAHTPPPSTHIARSKVYEHTIKDSEGTVLDTVNYTMSPIDLSTLAELEDYLRGEVLSVIEQQIIDKPPLIQEVIVGKALEFGDKRRIGTKEFDRAVQTFNGMAYLLFLSVRVKHPEFTPRLGRQILNESNNNGHMDKLASSLFTVTGFSTGKEKGQVKGQTTLTVKQ